MAKIKIGICDPHQDYAERFAWFVWHRLGDGCEASAYTKPQRLKAALAAGLDVLILTEAFYRQAEQQGSMPDLKAVPTVVLLTEAEGEAVSGFPCLYRYRAVGQLMEAVLARHRLQEKAAAVRGDSRMRKIVVFSPLGRCGKTSLAQALCQALGQVGSVLFLSFEVLNAHQEGSGRGLTVSDLLYGTLIHREAEDMLTLEDPGEQVWKLGSPVHPQDLSQAGPEVVMKMMEALERTKPRHFLVADLGDLPLPTPALLLGFDRILMPVLQDGISQKKLALWQQSLPQEEAALLAERTRPLDLTFLVSAATDPQSQEEAARELSALANRLMLEET